MELKLIGKANKTFEGVTEGKKYEIINHDYIMDNINDLENCIVLIENDLGNSKCYDAKDFEILFSFEDENMINDMKRTTNSMREINKFAENLQNQLREYVSPNSDTEKTEECDKPNLGRGMTNPLIWRSENVGDFFNQGEPTSIREMILRTFGYPPYDSIDINDIKESDGKMEPVAFDDLYNRIKEPRLLVINDVVKYDKYEDNCLVVSIYDEYASVITPDGKLVGLIKVEKLKCIKHAKIDEVLYFYNALINRLRNRYEDNAEDDNIVQDIKAFQEIEEKLYDDNDVLSVESISTMRTLFCIAPKNKEKGVEYTDKLIIELSELFKSVYDTLQDIAEGNVKERMSKLGEAVECFEHFGIDTSKCRSMLKAKIYMIAIYVFFINVALSE